MVHKKQANVGKYHTWMVWGLLQGEYHVVLRIMPRLLIHDLKSALFATLLRHLFGAGGRGNGVGKWYWDVLGTCRSLHLEVVLMKKQPSQPRKKKHLMTFPSVLVGWFMTGSQNFMAVMK